MANERAEPHPRPRVSGEERPDPEWVRGTCPRCGRELVANSYYVPGRGYLVLWECWGALRDAPACDYRRVL